MDFYCTRLLPRGHAESPVAWAIAMPCPARVPNIWHPAMRTYVRMAARRGARKQFDWVAMQAYIDAGNGFIRCRARFGIAHATWAKAIRLGDIRVNTAGKPYADARKRYDWRAVQVYYDAGHTYRACAKQFGFSAASWTKAVRRGEIVPRIQFLPIERILERSNRTVVKRRLIQAGILVNRCSLCGIDEWRGKPLSIQIDHINGVRDDNRLENLRMLCPNCHSQTETFAARNRIRAKPSIPTSSIGRAPDSDSGGSSFDPKVGSHGPIV